MDSNCVDTNPFLCFASNRLGYSLEAFPYTDQLTRIDIQSWLRLKWSPHLTCGVNENSHLSTQALFDKWGCNCKFGSLSSIPSHMYSSVFVAPQCREFWLPSDATLSDNPVAMLDLSRCKAHFISRTYSLNTTEFCFRFAICKCYYGDIATQILLSLEYPFLKKIIYPLKATLLHFSQ